MLLKNIEITEKTIEAFCQKNHIRRLSFFGSVIRDDFKPDSDVDVLVEFEPDAAVGFIKLAALERELSQIIGGRRVDLRTPADLSRYFRNDVLAEAVAGYVAKR